MNLIEKQTDHEFITHNVKEQLKPEICWANSSFNKIK